MIIARLFFAGTLTAAVSVITDGTLSSSETLLLLFAMFLLLANWAQSETINVLLNEPHFK